VHLSENLNSGPCFRELESELYFGKTAGSLALQKSTVNLALQNLAGDIFNTSPLAHSEYCSKKSTVALVRDTYFGSHAEKPDTFTSSSQCALFKNLHCQPCLESLFMILLMSSSCCVLLDFDQ
jgi:hypothetical protein